MPARYSLVSYMVDRREDVGNAVALNSTLFNTARMIGPTVGGFVIHAFGEAFCFFSNSFCYLSTLLALKKMRLSRPPVGKTGGRGRPLHDMADGLRIARDFAPYRYFLLLITATGFFAFPSITLMPAMAKSVLQRHVADARLPADGRGDRRARGLAADGFAQERSAPLVVVHAHMRGLRRRRYAFFRFRAASG